MDRFYALNFYMQLKKNPRNFHSEGSNSVFSMFLECSKQEWLLHVHSTHCKPSKTRDGAFL